MTIHGAAQALREANLTIALTGAGVSVESGIPDFRSKGGIWERYPPEEYGTIDAFREDPERFWGFWLELSRSVAAVKPNPAHHALAELERRGLLEAVVTQNVDGLHQAAGSKQVVELHGGANALVCLECGVRRKTVVSELTTPPRCPCGAIEKPDVVLFGELLPPGAFEKAESLAAKCDVLLVVGTSAIVYPAAALPEIAFAHDATIIQVDVAPNALTHTGRVKWFVQGKAGEVLPRLVELTAGASPD